MAFALILTIAYNEQQEWWGNGFKLRDNRIRLGMREIFFYREGDEMLEQVYQRRCGCPIIHSFQKYVGWGFEQCDLVEDICARSRGSNTKYSRMLWFHNSVLGFYWFPCEEICKFKHTIDGVRIDILKLCEVSSTNKEALKEHVGFLHLIISVSLVAFFSHFRFSLILM